MNPNVWGKHAWFFLHSITLAYPQCPSEEDKKNIKNFFENLHLVLPCPKCKINYKAHLDKTPLTDDILSSKYKLISWLINIHNQVNIMNGKPQLSYDQVLNIYTNEYYNVNLYQKRIIIMFIVIIFISVILLIMFKKMY